MHFQKIWESLRRLASRRQPARKKAARTRLELESLEERTVLTSTGTVTGSFVGASVVDAAVTLTSTSGPTIPVSLTSFTNDNGSFAFSGVPAGSYQISTAPFAGMDMVGTLSIGSVSTGAAGTIVAPLTLSSGQTLVENIVLDGGYGPEAISITSFLTSYAGVAPGPGKSDNTPTISNPIANQTVGSGTTGAFDLAGDFADAAITDDEVTFHITDNGVAETINENLDNTTAPEAVANFLDYVEAGDYNNAFFFRETNVTTDGIGILQAGGATIANTISDAIESGSTVTITTATANDFQAGQTVTIAGATVTGYNGAFTILSVSGNTFTYTDSTTGLAEDTSGTGSASGAGPQLITPLAPIPGEVSADNTNGSLAMAISANSPNSATDQFYFNTADNTSLDSQGIYTVFGQAADAQSQAVLDTLGATGVQDLGDDATISSASESGNTVTVTTSGTLGANFTTAGTSVLISGIATTGYDGTFTILSGSGDTFTYTDTTAGLATDTSGGSAIAGAAFAQANPSFTVNEVPLTGGTFTSPPAFPTSPSNYLVINSITIDKQNDFLTYSVNVTNSSTPNVVTATLTNEDLNLTYGAEGTATVNVTATDRYGAATTMSFNVTVVNQAPSGTSHTVTTLENTPYVFQESDFGFTDPNNPTNGLKAVEITTLPTAGTLTDKASGTAVAVTAKTFVPVADITAGDLVFTPTTDTSGSDFASFTFQVQNTGGTANGGVDTDPTPKTMTIAVTFVNQAPSGTSNAITIAENGSHTFTTSDFGFSDPNIPAQTLQAVEITAAPVAGTLTDNASGTAVVVAAGTFVPVADITGGHLVFTPTTDTSGSDYASFTFQVENAGGTANGGANIDPTPKNMTINVTFINQAPSGTSNTITIAENGSHTFSTSDFGFSDPNIPAETLQAVEITTAPTDGTLIDNASGTAVPVTAGTFVPVADITGGNLVYTPSANGTGSPFDSFTFQVQNNGGATDPSPKMMTIDVIVPNQAPSGTSNTVTTAENTPYVFLESDFGFTDPNSPPNSLQAVEITNVPTNGTLTDNASGTAVTVTNGTFVPVADIIGGNLVYTPTADTSGSPYDSFTFQVQNNGGTAAGGVDTDPSAKTMTIAVTFVNQAPSGTSNTITIAENGSHTFSTSDFGFSDPNIPAETLQAVEITTAPTDGTLIDNASGTAVPVTAGTFVPVADINGGNLVYTPAANGTGSPFDSFTFQVQNNGGTAAGGVNTDPTAKTMTIDVP